MRESVTSGTMRRRLLVATACASLAVLTACAEVVADSSACRKLEYKDGSVPRAQYLPCAGEMIAALEDLDRQTKAALDGDGRARAEGQATVRRVIGLMKAAGGMQLLERWDDRSLTSLNVSIHNAVTHYSAFYMISIPRESNQFYKQSVAGATAEYDGGHRRYEEAARLYRRMN
jgi:hypothetical protein